jgi:mono/diheme cytochrome c family protein
MPVKGGGNIVFTDSLLPNLKNIALKLTSSHLWDALGLPLTAFNDSRRRGSMRTITDGDFQPYQYAVVRMHDKSGHPFMAQGRAVEFFGTEPIDIANCYLCHSAAGPAAKASRQEGLVLLDREYAYWTKNYPDATDYVKRQNATMINILEIHDRRHGTDFLREYDAAAASNRLGQVGAVNCVDCHGDNISGNLQSPRPGTTGYRGRRGKPFTEAIHSVHARLAPMPDKAGRTHNCQTCHPAHWQSEKMNDYGVNSYLVTDIQGKPQFTEGDLRTAGGGCYLRRDAHTNPDVKPPFFLNAIGKWHLSEVSLKDETGKPSPRMRGLYCTNCHNSLAHELYRYDDLRDAALQMGKTLRNRSIGDVIGAVAVGGAEKFRTIFADPTVGAPGDPLYAFYAGHKSAILARAAKDKAGKQIILPWNNAAGQGKAIPYAAVSGGSDWWLSPGLPHCADCHVAPFVESMGGKYFPLDQPGKYALYRYSKAHGRLACQSCHESMHGLYPVRHDGPEKTVDLTTHQQALQFSPDGKYAGPVTCAACHTVNSRGVPRQLLETPYYADYWASVVLIHFMREGDQNIKIKDLVKKYPYERAKKIVTASWK